MAAATAKVRAQDQTKPMPAPRPDAPAATRIVLEGIRWSTYEALLEDLDDQPARLTYDDGSLEIMSARLPHERAKKLIGRLINTLTEELDVPIRSGGSTMFRKQFRKKGLEPDECHWVAREPRVRGKEDFDITEAPPPDIAVEVEISRSALDRMGIYAAIGVPEIWRYDGKSLTVEQLGADRAYHRVDRSPSFPWLPIEKLVEHLDRRDTMDETRWIKSFRAWVRAELAPTVAGRAEEPTGPKPRRPARRRQK